MLKKGKQKPRKTTEAAMSGQEGKKIKKLIKVPKKP